MRVLIVEDEVAVARQIASALTEAGHDPKTVHNGETALDEVRKTPFDLIVLDIRLPGIDGFQVLQRLRAQHLGSRVLLDRKSTRLNSSHRTISYAVFCLKKKKQKTSTKHKTVRRVVSSSQHTVTPIR